MKELYDSHGRLQLSDVQGVNQNLNLGAAISVVILIAVGGYFNGSHAAAIEP
jgi:hypothetical protein